MTLAPSFEEAEKAYEEGAAQVLYTRCVSDLDTPVSAYLKLTGECENSFLFESVIGGETLGRYSIIGFAPDLIWRMQDGAADINTNALNDKTAFVPCDEAPLTSLRTLLKTSAIDLPDDLPPMAAGLFGYLGYDAVRLMERLPPPNPDALGVPDGVYIRPTLIAIFDSIAQEIILVTPLRPAPGVSAREAYDAAEARLLRAEASLKEPLSAASAPPDEKDFNLRSNTPEADYLAMVRQAKEYIEAGDIFQVVLSQRFSAPFSAPPFHLYRSLRRTNPSPFLFFLNFGGYALVGSSPEILVRVRGDEITVRPIAGTRPRGATKAEDDALAADLLADPKERAEHLMLLDLGRNDVGRVSDIGTVTPTDQFTIERYSHVMHIVSNVIGTLRADIGPIDAVAAGFPAGTVSGAPKIRAMEIIDELEKEKRGPYAGAVGYFSAAGDVDTCIALRTAIVKDGVMYVQAGAGIVADSDPRSEHQECVNKSKALFAAGEAALARLASNS